MLSFSDLSAGYDPRLREAPVISGVSADVPAGTIVCVVGESGSGKSTLLKAIAGLTLTYSGKISVSAQTEFPIWYQSQSPVFLSFRNAVENVCLAREMREQLSSDSALYARQLVSELGLADHDLKMPSDLSGGMRRRLALAQSLFSLSPLLLLDEPFAELDARTRKLAESVLYERIKAEGRAAVVVTHDIDSAVAIGDNVVILAPLGLPKHGAYALNQLLGDPSARRASSAFPDHAAEILRLVVSISSGQ